MAENIEKEILDEDDDCVILKNADGEEIKFIDIAGIALSHGYYSILHPVELLEDMNDDEALVFKVEKTEDGNDKFSIVLDDKIIDEVFEEYYKLLDECGNNGDEQ